MTNATMPQEHQRTTLESFMDPPWGLLKPGAPHGEGLARLLLTDSTGNCPSRYPVNWRRRIPAPFRRPRYRRHRTQRLARPEQVMKSRLTPGLEGDRRDPRHDDGQHGKTPARECRNRGRFRRSGASRGDIADVVQTERVVGKAGGARLLDRHRGDLRPGVGEAEEHHAAVGTRGPTSVTCWAEPSLYFATRELSIPPVPTPPT